MPLVDRGTKGDCHRHRQRLRRVIGQTDRDSERTIQLSQCTQILVARRHRICGHAVKQDYVPSPGRPRRFQRDPDVFDVTHAGRDQQRLFSCRGSFEQARIRHVTAYDLVGITAGGLEPIDDRGGPPQLDS